MFFIVYELDKCSWDLNSDFTLKDCLFGIVKLAKDADADKYVYSCGVVGFDSCSEFSLPGGSDYFCSSYELICTLIIRKKIS